MSVTDKRILIIAGPNGAGKTTFAREYLVREADCPTFINADLIAAGLSPFAPERAAVQAGRLMLEAIDHAVAQGESFAFETTLAGLGYARKIPAWRSLGYRVSLFFLRLATVETAIERVATRVVQGGHSIAEAVIRRLSGRGCEISTRFTATPWMTGCYLTTAPSPRCCWTGEREMTTKPIEQAKNPLLAKAIPALERAAQQARRIAAQTGTDVVVFEGGRVRHIAVTDKATGVADTKAGYLADGDKS